MQIEDLRFEFGGMGKKLVFGFFFRLGSAQKLLQIIAPALNRDFKDNCEIYHVVICCCIQRLQRQGSIIMRFL